MPAVSRHALSIFSARFAALAIERAQTSIAASGRGLESASFFVGLLHEGLIADAAHQIGGIAWLLGASACSATVTAFAADG